MFVSWYQPAPIENIKFIFYTAAFWSLRSIACNAVTLSNDYPWISSYINHCIAPCIMYTEKGIIYSIDHSLYMAILHNYDNLFSYTDSMQWLNKYGLLLLTYSTSHTKYVTQRKESYTTSQLIAILHNYDNLFSCYNTESSMQWLIHYCWHAVPLTLKLN